MENIDDIIIPSEPAKKTAKKVNKTVLVEKESLPRVNRKVTCGYCQVDKILNPKQYQELFDVHGSEEKVESEFMCKPCEMDMKKNPFMFWAKYGNVFDPLIKEIRTIFDSFRASKREVSDGVQLQNSTTVLFSNSKVPDTNFEFLIENGSPVGILIKNMPFVGQIYLLPYSSGKDRVKIN